MYKCIYTLPETHNARRLYTREMDAGALTVSHSLSTHEPEPARTHHHALKNLPPPT